MVVRIAEEDIMGFNIPMHNVELVKVTDAAHGLLKNVFRIQIGKSFLAFLNVICQISLTKLQCNVAEL